MGARCLPDPRESGLLARPDWHPPISATRLLGCAASEAGAGAPSGSQLGEQPQGDGPQSRPGQLLAVGPPRLGLEGLPTELLAVVLAFLDVKDRLRCEAVSTQLAKAGGEAWRAVRVTLAELPRATLTEQYSFLLALLERRAEAARRRRGASGSGWAPPAVERLILLDVACIETHFFRRNAPHDSAGASESGRANGSESLPPSGRRAIGVPGPAGLLLAGCPALTELRVEHRGRDVNCASVPLARSCGDWLGRSSSQLEDAARYDLLGRATRLRRFATGTQACGLRAGLPGVRRLELPLLFGTTDDADDRQLAELQAAVRSGSLMIHHAAAHVAGRRQPSDGPGGGGGRGGSSAFADLDQSGCSHRRRGSGGLSPALKWLCALLSPDSAQIRRLTIELPDGELPAPALDLLLTALSGSRSVRRLELQAVGAEMPALLSALGHANDIGLRSVHVSLAHEAPSGAIAAIAAALAGSQLPLPRDHRLGPRPADSEHTQFSTAGAPPPGGHAGERVRIGPSGVQRLSFRGLREIHLVAPEDLGDALGCLGSLVELSLSGRTSMPPMLDASPFAASAAGLGPAVTVTAPPAGVPFELGAGLRSLNLNLNSSPRPEAACSRASGSHKRARCQLTDGDERLAVSRDAPNLFHLLRALRRAPGLATINLHSFRVLPGTGCSQPAGVEPHWPAHLQAAVASLMSPGEPRIHVSNILLRSAPRQPSPVRWWHDREAHRGLLVIHV